MRQINKIWIDKWRNHLPISQFQGYRFDVVFIKLAGMFFENLEGAEMTVSPESNI
ncbi:MAG: hypothetical protein U5R49_24750 [Deltaproteobacteria bacterium]|nr:hypothetical protein [Deltaproteobacteria bacterium]